MKSPRVQLLLVTLAIAVYVPLLAFPFVAGSYIEIPISRFLGSWQALPALLSNPNWHFRISYVFANSWLVQWFGFEPRPFYIASLCLHALCVALIYELGRWRELTYKASAWAAGFFAVYEGHHAAVASLVAWPDLLVTIFTCAALLFWIRWVQAGERPSYALALLFFVLALASYESAVLVPILFALVLFLHRIPSRAQIVSFVPVLVLAVCAFVVQLVFRARYIPWAVSGLGLDPWWISAAWTAGALLTLVLFRAPTSWKFAGGCILWVLVTFAAGTYLAGILQVGSYVSYLASLGIALLIGYTLSKVQDRVPIRVIVGIGLLILVLNVSLLWTKRRKQIFDLAAPTEILRNAAAYAQGPIRLSCFPYSFEIAEAAAGSVGARITSESKDNAPTPHCVSFSYKDSLGRVRQVFVRSAK